MCSRPASFALPAACLILVAVLHAGARVLAEAFPEPFNTEKPGLEPMPAAQAAASFVVPDRFQVRVFASEPDIRQPIAMTTDSRGRLWVAENYTYAESKVNFATELRDRVVILEDTNHDGRFDRRTVFWDRGSILTSLELGRGGVFVLCPPKLLFIPVKPGTDEPAGEPQVLLDGFTTTTGNRHTFANGLKWGPDGWLWGRIGISSGAHIGRPGSPDSARVEMRGGIWRYHPERHVIEAVSHGTTNPWGLDWNAEGEPFFINTVIGHLWHAIPGAHFRRMHGDDVNPHAYALIEQHADHFHFDTAAGWTKSRAALDGSQFAAGSDILGGGHAHAGLLIYQGDNWPESFRNEVFTINLHGRRLNQEHLEREGTGYVARHRPDLMQAGDTWFRGLDLIPAPDGSVYLSDWSDTGECHDSDGVHRTSGRIYNLHYTKAVPASVPADITALTEAALIARVADRNEWISRQARQALADRAAVGKLGSACIRQLRDGFDRAGSTHDRLRHLWALNAVGGASLDWLTSKLKGQDEHVTSWMVRLLADRMPLLAEDPAQEGEPMKALRALERFASGDHPPLVQLYLASALQRVPVGSRGPLVRALLEFQVPITDHNFPLMLWYGMESWVAAMPAEAARAFVTCRHRQVRQFIARRLGERLPGDTSGLEPLLTAVGKPGVGSLERQQDLLRGLAESLRGIRRSAPPVGWDQFATAAKGSADTEVQARLRELSVVFGDGRAADDLRRVVADAGADPLSRRNALRALVESRAEAVAPLLKNAIQDGVLRPTALLGLLQIGDPEGPSRAVSNYPWLGLEERPPVLSALCATPAAARALLDAVAAGTIPRAEVTAFQARQIAGLGLPALSSRLTEVWGAVRPADPDHRAAIDRMRARLTPSGLKAADLIQGEAGFRQLCSPCHRLYGTGGEIGPDLTGSGRSNLDYLLENVMDPNAVVPAGYRLTTATLKDGRSISGILRDETARTVTLQAPGQTQVIDRHEIQGVETSNQSMMPEGLLETLSFESARNLLAFLMNPGPLSGVLRPPAN